MIHFTRLKSFVKNVQQRCERGGKVTDDLPTLKIGCGKDITYLQERVDQDNFFYCREKGSLCPECQFMKDGVLPVELMKE